MSHVRSDSLGLQIDRRGNRPWPAQWNLRLGKYWTWKLSLPVIRKSSTLTVHVGHDLNLVGDSWLSGLGVAHGDRISRDRDDVRLATDGRDPPDEGELVLCLHRDRPTLTFKPVQNPVD